MKVEGTRGGEKILPKKCRRGIPKEEKTGR